MSTATSPPVHPASGPPDRIALAEHDAGLPSDPGTGRHVAACLQCQAVLAALRAVRADVASLVGTPMPTAIADRIGSALTAARAAEVDVADHPETSSGTAAQTAAEPAAGSETVQPATAAAPAAGSEGGAQQLPEAEPAGSETGQPPALLDEPDSGRHRQADAAELATYRRGRWRNATAGIAAGIVLFGGGTYLLTQPGGSESATSSVDSGGSVSSGNDPGRPAALPSYDRVSLQAAVPTLLTSATAAGGGGSDAESSGEGQDQTHRECLAGIPVSGSTLLTSVRALYEGQDALILILDTADPARVQVTVVSADCGSGTDVTVLDAFETAR